MTMLHCFRGAHTVEVISKEEVCTLLKPLALMTGRDGQEYCPAQALGHVLGVEKNTLT